jgi:hypothetical protein
MGQRRSRAVNGKVVYSVATYGGASFLLLSPSRGTFIFGVSSWGAGEVGNNE